MSFCPSSPRRLLLVDGHAYAYRSFFAIRSLSAPDGFPTNAIYGFIKALIRLREQAQPTHLLVVWDGGLAAERMALLPDYKAQRPPMPDDLERQLDGMVAYLGAAGLASFCREGVEADDWVGSVARQAVAAGGEAVVASADKDFMQLVGPGLFLLNPNDKSGQLWTEAQVREKSGVAPGQVVDWLSLVGDSVDNIPGVAGIGPKTAADLLRDFGSLEHLLARLDEVRSERLRAKLDAARELLARNRRLVALREDLAVAFRWDDYLPQAPKVDELAALYGRWGFQSMLAELNLPGAPRQAELF